MGPRKKGANIKSTGATSSKAAPLPDWVKNKNAPKPAPAPAPARPRPNASGPNPSAPSSHLGNAGSTGGKEGPHPQATGPTAAGPPQHLFPIGSKPPLNLLIEKVAAHTRKASGKEAAWLKPVLDVRRIPASHVSAWAEPHSRLLLAERARRTEAQAQQPKRKPSKKNPEPDLPPESFSSYDLATALIHAQDQQDLLPPGFSSSEHAAAFGVDVGGVLEAYHAALHGAGTCEEAEEEAAGPGASDDTAEAADASDGDSRKKSLPAAWTATVTMTREGKGHNTAGDTVKMSPDDRLHPELRIYALTAQHARQWAATYALFRLFTLMPMHRMLPPGPREYWKVMESFQTRWAGKERQFAREKSSNSPLHVREERRRAQLLSYLWDADPFAALARRQAAAAAAEQSRTTASALQAAVQRGDHESAEKLAVQQQREQKERQQAIASGKLGPSSAAADAAAAQATQKEKAARKSVWDEAPTLHVPLAHRDLLQTTIHQGFAHFPAAAAAAPASDPSGSQGDSETSPTPTPTGESEFPSHRQRDDTDVNQLASYLQQLGFRPGYARSAASWVAAARQRLARGEVRDTLDRAALAALSGQSDEQAGLEYLLMYTPAEDLPPKFAYKHRQRGKAPEEFVSGGASGVGGELDIGMRWLVERVSSTMGVPLNAVVRAAHRLLAFEGSHPHPGDQWSRDGRQGVLVDMLLAALVRNQAENEGGAEAQEEALQSALAVPADGVQAQSDHLAQEREILTSFLGEERVSLVDPKDWPMADPTLDARAFQAIDIRLLRQGEDVRLRLTPHPANGYGILPSSKMTLRPTAFIVSQTLPSYIRLALTRLVQSPGPKSVEEDLAASVESGSGSTMLLLEQLETDLDQTIDHPPPLNEVLRCFMDAPTPITTPDRSSTPSQPARKEGRKLQALQELSPAAAEELVQRAQSDRTAWENSKEYQSNYGRVRHSLPAWASRQSFLDLLAQAPGRVILTAGETGCGKTTQCPQFILDEAIAKGTLAETNVVVTQPRRVAAVAVAQRVAAERGEVLSSQRDTKVKNPFALTGYAIRGERKAGANCRLLFCTTGVLLRRLTGSGLRGISHIVVDEVHERSVDSDVLLLHLRAALQMHPTLKVILMSATVEQETFVRYFGGCPVLTIPGRTFPVTDLYLEDILRLTNYDPASSTSGSKGKIKPISDAQKGEIAHFTAKHAPEPLNEGQTRSLITLTQRTQETTDYDLLARTILLALSRSASAHQADPVGGAILVFVSGVGEIRSASEAIERFVAAAGHKATVLPLHANLSPQEQRLVFEPTRHTKVVVATNVAETSITIPDISYVVDSGKVKENRWDPALGLNRLEEVWASRAAARQRRGRAGRVRQGECFRLYSRHTEQTLMPGNQTPEMLRTPLHNLILSVMATTAPEPTRGDTPKKDMSRTATSLPDPRKDVKAFLLQALSPPKIEHIDAALRDLIDAGALHPSRGVGSHGSLTALGRHLASLPLDLRLGKMLILGGLFGCLDPALTIAAFMTSKPIFVAPFEKRDEANRYVPVSAHFQKFYCYLIFGSARVQFIVL